MPSRPRSATVTPAMGLSPGRADAAIHTPSCLRRVPPPLKQATSAALFFDDRIAIGARSSSGPSSGRGAGETLPEAELQDFLLKHAHVASRTRNRMLGQHAEGWTPCTWRARKGELQTGTINRKGAITCRFTHRFTCWWSTRPCRHAMPRSSLCSPSSPPCRGLSYEHRIAPGSAVRSTPFTPTARANQIAKSHTRPATCQGENCPLFRSF